METFLKADREDQGGTNTNGTMLLKTPAKHKEKEAIGNGGPAAPRNQ